MKGKGKGKGEEGKGKGKGKDRLCCNCGKPGHLATDCRAGKGRPANAVTEDEVPNIDLGEEKKTEQWQ